MDPILKRMKARTGGTQLAKASTTPTTTPDTSPYSIGDDDNDNNACNVADVVSAYASYVVVAEL